jgi:membrane-bound lytic murein transglycosylase B
MLPFLTPSRPLSQPRLRPGLVLPVLVVLTACAVAQPSAAHRSRHAITAPKPEPAADAQFYAFIRRFRAEALKAGIRPWIYDRSMRGLALNTHIQELNNKQPEFVKPIWDYLDSAVSDKRVAHGREKLAANARMLAKLQSRFGIPKAILVAIWGIETNYGAQTGHYNMFEALATLGYGGRRAAFGRRELIAALKMEQREGYRPKQMVSSWAGAFGQTQFMPSTFLAHAIDGDGNGRIDLWTSPADALASTAAMLDQAGWQRGEPWGYEVRLPAHFPYAQADSRHARPLAHWRALGVTTAMGAALPPGPDKGAILLPAGAHGPAFLVFHNFRTILRYNNATAYALAVSLLADRIGGRAAIHQSWPRDEEPLSRAEAKAFQENLKRLGYDPGPIDGILGGKVRAALRAYQRAHGLKPDGFATQALLQRMERELAAKGG